MSHTITAEISVLFSFPGLPDDERESANPKLEIEYSYKPGAPPSFNINDGGDPGWPAEIELISAKLLDGDGLDPEPAQVNEWALNWLHGDGYDEACGHAEDDRKPDPDAAYEQARDDAIDFPERGGCDVDRD